MAKILILYSTTDGHTLRICQRIAALLEVSAHKVTIKPLPAVDETELQNFDRIVIGASIRYGKHKPEVAEFVTRNCELLESRQGCFFSVNVVARKPEKNQPHTNPYAKKFLDSIVWKPTLAAVFAGKINYPTYSFWDRNMIRLIMWMTKGPTDPTAVIEFTDWQKVDDFASEIAEL